MTKINEYTLVEPPLKGGMAIVYKGQKGAFTRAFKMLRPDKTANNPRLCERFLKEIEVQSKLDHPNIIKLLDAYPYTDSSGKTATVLEMEWLNGMDLQRFVDHRAGTGLDTKTVVKIAMQIISGMEYAHNKKILHLDLKPSNIFRTFDGYIKIIDFGIARVVGENADIVEGAETVTMVAETGESSFKGTLAYSPLEQQTGKKLTFATDIFSFGRTIQFIATGSTDPSADVGDALLNKIIFKCTQSNPKHRYQSFAEVRTAFTNGGTPEFTECSKCKAKISKSAKFCPECGEKVIQSTTKPKNDKCPKCGKERIGTTRFCDNCGFDYLSDEHSKQKVLSGYVCGRCHQTTKPYMDGIVNFCNHCGAPASCLTPKYK